MNTTVPAAEYPSAPAPQPGTCTAATLYLMSQYAHRPCPLIAHAIADQLARLAQACTGNAWPAMQQLALALLPQWQRIACGNSGGVRH